MAGWRRCCQRRVVRLRFAKARQTVFSRTFTPKFLRIGVHQSNVSGYTSKAWCVRRIGSTIFLKWGAVEVQGTGAARKVYWSRLPQEKTIRCRTAQRAQDYAKAAIARRRSHRYEPLTGAIGRRRPAARSPELKQAPRHYPHSRHRRLHRDHDLCRQGPQDDAAVLAHPADPVDRVLHERRHRAVVFGVAMRDSVIADE